jgi:uncharacterized membrane protein (UPF0127 family)
VPSFLSPLLVDPTARWAIGNVRTGELLADSVETAFDSPSRRRGLLGRDGLAHGAALIIAPCSSIHMFFMRFPIDVVFAGRDGRIVRICHTLRPWRIAFGSGAWAVIEMPSGSLPRETRRGDYVEVIRVDAAARG